MEVLKLETWINEFGESKLNLDKLQEYLDFIVQAVERFDLERYSEWHHMMPKCIDHGKHREEGVRVNGADHFRAHMKLVECFVNGPVKFKLSSSLTRMNPRCLDDGVPPEEYERGKEYFVENMSKFREFDYTGANNPFYGRRHSQESKEQNRIAHLRENLSESTLRKMSEHHRDVSGDNNPMKSKTARLKLSKSMKGKSKTEEHKRRISESLKGKRCGESHPMFGKKHSDESVRKMVEAKIGKNNPNYGKIWITNGVSNKHILPEVEIPRGWWKGKSRKSY